MSSEAIEGAAAIPDRSYKAAVYEAICKRNGIVGKIISSFGKLRGGMEKSVGLQLKAIDS